MRRILKIKVGYNKKFDKKNILFEPDAYNLLTGDNLVSMLLKPSYTTQESEKVLSKPVLTLKTLHVIRIIYE